MSLDRPKRVKRVIRCEACSRIRRFNGSSKVWVEAAERNPLTGMITTGGYLARICRDCRPEVGYKTSKNGDKEKG